MNIVNDTPFAFAPLVGKVVYPKDTITFIIKATFDLKPDAPVEAVPAGNQLPPTGDLFYDDDPQTSVRYESDFSYFKPKADVMVVGHCHVPGGGCADACPVAVKIGPIAKSLMVLGDRTSRRTIMGTRSQSAPEPFAAMAIRYENSFGGAGYKRNPVGKGMPSSASDQAHADNRLPNLKVLEGDQLATMHAGIPSGFGPLGRTWAQRMAFVGSYGSKWKRERWPWFPEDFDWRFFNAAPSDQQVAGYLKGDEALYIKNMHPEHTEWRTQLPGIRVRCFLSERLDGKLRFREVKTRLDTLWIDMDEAKLVLVWRGLATVASAGCEQIDHLLMVQERLSDPPLDPAHYERLLEKRIAAAALETKAEAPVAVAVPDEDGGAGSAWQIREDGIDDHLEAIMAQARKSLDRSGLDPRLVRELTTEKDPERFLETMARGLHLDSGAIEKAQARTRRQFKKLLDRHQPEVEKALARGGREAPSIEAFAASLFGRQAPAATPPPDVEAIAAAVRSGEDVADMELAGADFSGISLEGANFRAAQLAGADFSNARLAGSDFSQANLENAVFQGADLSGVRFKEADLNHGRLNGARLQGADFSDAVLTAAHMVGADLSQAKLCRAQLARADLSASKLIRADLEQADLTQTRLIQADLDGARLSMTILDGANLTRSNAAHAEGAFTSLVGSDLTEADFSRAALEDCNFSDCRCDFASFQAARLPRATFEGAVGRQVNFRQAQLDAARAGAGVRMPESVFRRARAANANWSGADLTGADLILAEMPHCDFSRANLAGSDGRTAELSQAVFRNACLKQARFNRANLFQSVLEAADLTGADFKGCNLFGAEFLNASIDDRTNFRQANLKGTKLAGGNS